MTHDVEEASPGVAAAAAHRPAGPATPAWRGHVGYVVGVTFFVCLLAWLTAREGHVAFGLITYAVLFAIAYRLVAAVEKRATTIGENLRFAVLALGLLGFLAVLTGGQPRAFVPIYTTIAIFALFALGLNLQFGYTGIINFGHVAFMAIGAYTTVLLSGLFVPHAEILLAPRPSLLVLLLLILFSAMVLGVLASVALERMPGFRGLAPARRRAVILAGGAGGAVAAALVVLAVVPMPLTPLWAAAVVIGAAAALGMLVAAVAGILLGLPTIRLRADYLAIVTIGAAEILRRAIRNEAWLTRGHSGIGQFPLPFSAAGREWPWLEGLARVFEMGGYPLLRFLMALSALLLVVLTLAVLLRSPYGRVLRAIREDEEVARAAGKNVFRFKLQVFALGGAIAALAGAILAWDAGYISPADYVPLVTFWAWIIVVIGGIGNNKGTIVGAIILWTFFDGSRFLDLEGTLGVESGPFRMVVIGVLLIVLMLFKPEGLMGRRQEMILGR